MRQELDPQPAALAGLMQDKVYRLQNRSFTPIYLQRAAAPPDASGRGAYKVRPGATWPVEKLDGTEVYVWQPQPVANNFVVYEEMPA